MCISINNDYLKSFQKLVGVWILVCVMLVRVRVCSIQMSDVGVCNAGVCVWFWYT